MKHLGHSCLFLEVAGRRLLIDPGTFNPEAVEQTDLDAVLITHAHPDHMDIGLLRSLLAASPGIPVIAEPDAAATLDAGGIEAQPLPSGGSAALGGVGVHAVGGTHAMAHEELPRIGNIGLVVTANGEPTFFDPGDDLDTVPGTAMAPDGVDLLALPVAGPWVTIPAATDLLRRVAPRAWIPVHDGVLSPAGRVLFLNVLGSLAPENTELRDLAGAGLVEV